LITDGIEKATALGCKNGGNVDTLYLIFTVNKIHSVSCIRSSGSLAIMPAYAMLKLHMQEVSDALPSQKLIM
jgi:hypothetical protein